MEDTARYCSSWDNLKRLETAQSTTSWSQNACWLGAISADNQLTTVYKSPNAKNLIKRGLICFQWSYLPHNGTTNLEFWDDSKGTADSSNPVLLYFLILGRQIVQTTCDLEKKDLIRHNGQYLITLKSWKNPCCFQYNSSYWNMDTVIFLTCISDPKCTA